jgi:hypothetical protein
MHTASIQIPTIAKRITSKTITTEEPKILSIGITEIASTIEEKMTKEYQSTQLNTTKLINDVPKSVSGTVLMTTIHIASHTINISLSSTESSGRSDILLFLYFIPSLLIFLTCVILTTIHLILRYHRQHKQRSIVEQDSSIRSSITSESLTFL